MVKPWRYCGRSMGQTYRETFERLGVCALRITAISSRATPAELSAMVQMRLHACPMRKVTRPFTGGASLSWRRE